MQYSRSNNSLLFGGVTLTILLVVLCLTTSTYATSCQCFVAAQPNAHCSSSFTSKVAVVRARVSSTTTTATVVVIEEVLFNNSPVYFYMNQEVKVSTPTCTPSVQVSSKYFIRITVESDNSLTIAACDYVVPESSVSNTSSLSCGQTLTDCQRYPCPPDTPKCTSSTIACFTTPCPQRTCGICNVACPLLGCGPGFRSYTPPGECCATQCIADNDPLFCAGVACPAIACGEGSTLIKSGGDCCGICLSCSSVQCPLLGCGPGFRHTPPGECCARCISDNNPVSCAGVTCPAIACGEGSTMVKSNGNCCGTCESCSSVQCPLLGCGPGLRYYTPPGECCATQCIPDNCSNAVCPAIACGEGSTLIKSDGDCCGTCEPCSSVQCPAVTCRPGEVAQVPTGQCCPECQCQIFCSAIFCPEGSHAEALPGRDACSCDSRCVPNSASSKSLSLLLVAIVIVLVVMMTM